jgi:hypothetical protein
MACRYTYKGKTYSATEFGDVLRAMSLGEAAKYMGGVQPIPEAGNKVGEVAVDVGAGGWYSTNKAQDRLGSRTGPYATEAEARADNPRAIRIERDPEESPQPGFDITPELRASAMRGLPLFARAWHGTPHTFAPTERNALGEFDLSKMSTGEGAQAIAWGIYVAENDAVSKTYMTPELTYQRTSGHLTNKQELVVDMFDMGKPETEILKEYASRYGGSFDDAQADLDHIKSMRGGSLYEIDVPDSAVAKMLDWDLPIESQPQAIQNIVSDMSPMQPGATGKDFYQSLLNDSFARTYPYGSQLDKTASFALRDAGIPGVKFLDQGSRGTGEGSRNFVVFDAATVTIMDRNGEKLRGAEKTAAVEEIQVKQAEAAEGARYSRAAGPAPDPNTAEGSAAAVDRIGQAMRAARRGGDAVKSKVLEDWRPAQLKFATRRQVVEIGRDMVPELADYDRGVQRMDGDRTVFDGESGEVATIAENFMLGLHEGSQSKTTRGLKRVGAFFGLTPVNKEADEVFDLMTAATLAGTDPAEGGFRPGINKGEALREMAILRRKMRGRPGEAYLLQAQIDELQVRLDNEKVRKAAHPALARRYAVLSAEAKNVYVRMRDLYMKRFDQREEALIQAIRDAEEGEQWKRRLITDIKHRFETARISAPYFPLDRFGDLWVRAINPDGEREYHHRESGHQQKALVEELTRAGYHDITHGLKLEDLFKEQGASAGFVTDVIKLLDQGTHMTHQARADLKDAIYQMYLQSLPELSVRRHWIHRHKTPGYSKDMLRVFAKSMFHGNRQLALLRNQTAMDKALNAARNRVERGFDPAHEPLEQALKAMRELKKKGDPELVALEQALATARKSVRDNLDPVRGGQLVKEMQKRHEWVKNPTIASWAHNASGLGFLWYLTAPASAIVNVTQTPLVAFPILAARHGWGRAGKELNRAMVDYFKGRFSIEGALQGEELAAYKRFLGDGVIDRTRTFDLAGQSETPSAIYKGRVAKTTAAAGWMFHRAEMANREITALAAYRLARADGLGIEAAYEQAKELTKDAHLDYSNSNKPPFLQHDVSRVLLMFKQFSQGMYWLLGRSAHQWRKGLTREARDEARTRLTGILGMHALFAGAMGMPLIGTVAMVMNALFDDEDEPWDFWTEFRNFLTDVFDADWARAIIPEFIRKEAAQAIARGPMDSLIGFAVSSRVSLGDLLIREPDPNLEGRGLVEWGIEQVTGPLGGMALKAGTAYELWQDGNTRRALESMTPAPIRNGLQMLRYADEGVRSLRGDPLMEDVSTWNLFGQGLGFSPAELGRKYDANRALKDLEQRTLDRRERLINRWWLARSHGDNEGVQEAMVEIGRFNGSTIIGQNARARITPATLLASMQARRNYSRRAEGGIIVDRRLSRLGERVRFGG